MVSPVRMTVRTKFVAPSDTEAVVAEKLKPVSSSVIVAVAVTRVPRNDPAEGLLIRTEKVSVGSTTALVKMRTVIVWDDSPTKKVSVPLVAA